jgi:hypothetical protein
MKVPPMSDEQGVQTNWKSKLLADLGIKSGAVIEHGPAGAKCGRALTAALAVALGCTTPAHAQEQSNLDSSAISSITAQYGASVIEQHASGDMAKVQPDTSLSKLEIASEVGSAVLDPQRTLLKASTRFVIGGAVGALTDSKDTGDQVANIAGAAIGSTLLGPVVGAYIIYDQAQETYAFVKERQQQKLDQKLAQVATRIERVQAEEVMRIRLVERQNRSALPEDAKIADQEALLKLVEDFKETGYLEPALQARVEVEKAVEKAGFKTEAWYSSYVQAASPTQQVESPSTRERFLVGLNNLNLALEDRNKNSLQKDESATIKMPGLR